jgi:hypothetical protein
VRVFTSTTAQLYTSEAADACDKRCEIAGTELTYTADGGLFYGFDDADYEQMAALLVELNSAPGAKEAVKAILRTPSESRSAAVS